MKKLFILTLATLFITQTNCSLTERLEAAETQIAAAKENFGEANIYDCDVSCVECG